jgi:hypothetical protein
VFIAEITEVTRFTRPGRLASWASLTRRHYESDTTMHRGRITKQGATLVRWSAIEAAQRIGTHTRLGRIRDRIAERRGRNIGVVADARELITFVSYGLRSPHLLPTRPNRVSSPQNPWWTRIVQAMTPDRATPGRRGRSSD